MLEEETRKEPGGQTFVMPLPPSRQEQQDRSQRTTTEIAAATTMTATVFTVDDDLNSRRVVTALKEFRSRSPKFSVREISLSDHPEKRSELRRWLQGRRLSLATTSPPSTVSSTGSGGGHNNRCVQKNGLHPPVVARAMGDGSPSSDSNSVPQVFFGTAWIGGVEETMRALEEEKLEACSREGSAKNSSGDDDAKLIQRLLELDVDDTPSDADATGSACCSAPSSSCIPPGLNTKTLYRVPTVSIRLPTDSTMTTYWDIADKVKNTLPLSDVLHQGTLYRNCFRGDAAAREISLALDISANEAIEFGSVLLDSNVVQVIHKDGAAVDPAPTESGRQLFDGGKDSIYRMQCHATPEVLNSYRIWPTPSQEENQECAISISSSQVADPLEVVDALDALLRAIELESIESGGRNKGKGGTSRHKVSHSRAILNQRYPMFEESVCELQVVDLKGSFSDDGDYGRKLAFALNLYKLMLRYAFLKVGVPVTEQDRVHFLRNVKFNIGGDLYSFQEWLDGVLRGNAKVTNSTSPLFNRHDHRREFTLMPPPLETSSFSTKRKLDGRLHFAVNTDPMLGSPASLPFPRFSPGAGRDVNNIDGASSKDEDIIGELEVAARVFCADNTNVFIDHVNVVVGLSKIFAWYRSDFGTKKDAMLKRICGYLEGSKKLDMQKVLSSKKSYKIEFVDVNWTRNVSDFLEYDKKSLVGDATTIKTMLRRFKPPKPTPDEGLRLSTLHGLNMLDTLPEERFDRITRMVKDEFDVPLCVVSLIDSDRQWFKSVQWECPVPQLSTCETSRDVSFCGHTIHKSKDEIMVVENTLEDDRFAENPLVAGGLNLRFYAGATLSVPTYKGSSNFVNIGTLCILDLKPRGFGEAEQATLLRYAQDIKEEILRREMEDCE